MMKFLAVIVVFAVFAASQASDAPEQFSKVEQWLDYLSSIWPLAVDTLVRASGSKTVNALGRMDFNLSQRFNRFRQEFPPEVVETIELVEEVSGGVARKAHRAANDLKNTQEIEPILMSALSYSLDPVLTRVEPYVKPFQSTLTAWTQGIFEKVPQEIEMLDDQLSFYTKQLEDIYASLQPLAEQAITRLRQGVEALNKNLNPYLKPILEESRKYKTEFEQWVDTPIFPQNT